MKHLSSKYGTLAYVVGAQDSIGNLCANYRRLLVSGNERSHSERAVGTPIVPKDTNQSSEDWHSVFVFLKNARVITKLLSDH
jgi:hypothetical protein